MGARTGWVKPLLPFHFESHQWTFLTTTKLLFNMQSKDRWVVCENVMVCDRLIQQRWNGLRSGFSFWQVKENSFKPIHSEISFDVLGKIWLHIFILTSDIYPAHTAERTRVAPHRSKPQVDFLKEINVFTKRFTKKAARWTFTHQNFPLLLLRAARFNK